MNPQPNTARARRTKTRIPAALALLFVLAGLGAEIAPTEWKLPSEKTQLKPGAGRELVIGQCLVCHSADYISTQPRFARPVWQATVAKMGLSYGAQVATNRVAALVDYLVAAYGTASPAK